MDYDVLPFRCRSCLSSKYKVKDCKGFVGRTRGHGKAPVAPHRQPQRKNKEAIIDQEGFQMVSSRRLAMRILFEEGEEIGKISSRKSYKSNKEATKPTQEKYTRDVEGKEHHRR